MFLGAIRGKSQRLQRHLEDIVAFGGWTIFAFAVIPGISKSSGSETAITTSYVTTFCTVIGDRLLFRAIEPLKGPVRKGFD